MPFTRTYTATRTFTRVDLMKMQIDRVLGRCYVSQASARQILVAVDKRWLAQISVYGVDGNAMCVAELYIEIDWDRNAMHVAASKNTVTIDGRWNNGISIEVEKALALFEELCTEQQLKTTWRIRYRSSVNSESANTSLGFVAAKPIQWRGGTMGSAMSPPELDEFTVGVKIAE